MKRFIAIIVFLALAVGMPVLIYKVYNNNKRLMNEGIDVEATIVSVDKAGRTNNVKVEYTNNKGEKITAKGIINDGNYDVGRTFKGKYLPDDPKTVHLPAKKTLMWLVYGIMGFLGLLGWIVTFALIKGFFTRKSVGANGIITRAQVVNYDRQTRVCTVEFKRADGLSCRADIVSDIPYGMGSYVTIKYIPKGTNAKAIILGY